VRKVQGNENRNDAMKRLLSVDDNGQGLETILNLLREHGYAVQEAADELSEVRDVLRESENRFRMIVETAEEGIWQVDRDWKTTYVNRRMERMLGCEPGSMLGLHIHDFMDDEGRRTVLEHISRREQGISETHDFRFVRRDGSMFDVLVSANPLIDARGEVVGSLAMVTDITARKQVVDELQRSKDLLQAIIEAAPTAIIGLDLDGRVQTVWNHAAEKMLGWSAEEAMGRYLPSVTADKEEEFQRFRESIRSGKTLNGKEVRRQRRDGTPIDYSIYASPLHSLDGQIIGNIAVLVDITERKRTEIVMSARMRLLEFSATHTLDELLEATLNEAEALTGSCIGFYHYLEADQKTLSLQNWSARTKKEFCRAEGKGLHYDVSAAGVWVDCIRQRRPIIHNDYASLPHRKGLPPGHAPVVRELVVPVFRGESIEAIFGVGNKACDYTRQDVEIVSLLADLAWGIVEYKRAEEELRESEEKFRVLAETSPTAIFLYQDEMIIYANPATERLFGYDAAELLRMTFWDWAHEDFREMVRDRGLKRLRGEPVPPRYECRFVTKAGEDRWLVVSAGLIDYHGRATGVASFLDITDIKKAEQQLQTSLAEKEILLKEVHHRVKNNLQIISSLLELQSEYIVEEHSRRFIKESQDRITSIALVHEQLYRSTDLSFIDFACYVDELVDSLCRSLMRDPERIRVKVEIRDIELGIDEAIPCGLIINELVSNSLKHAFPGDGEGEILIQGARDGEGGVRLSVTDTGIGLPPGLNLLETETLGLQIVGLLTRQLHGTMEIRGDNGVTVTVRFPVEAYHAGSLDRS
jgi:PAS domain S-box-containing protein